MPESPSQAEGTQAGSSEAQQGESALDQLLSEWEKQGSADTEATKPSGVSGATALKALKPVVDFAQQQMTEKQTEGVTKDIDAAVEFISEPDELKGLKSSTAIGLLEAYAREDPSFTEAFNSRKQSPQEWKAGLEKARDWVKTTVAELRGTEGSTSTRSDVEAAKAAVQGQTNQAADDEQPDPTAMFKMSDDEFGEVLAKERAKAAN
jgi:hypothetical protein